jgi:hypothetical protein
MHSRLMAMAMVVWTAALVGSARAEVLDPNLAGWWRFDDGSGTKAVDSSGHERHGVLIGSPQWVAGIRKGALAFDGGGNHVVVSGYEGVLGPRSRTCAAWVKVSNTSASIITWGPSGTGTKWVVRTHNGPAVLRAECGQGNIIGTVDLTNGEWHHVAVVLADDSSPNADEIKLYVDAALDKISSVTPRAVNTSTGGDVQIAYDLNNTGRTFQGSMDDVRVYTRALSGTEIAGLMKDETAVPTQAVSPEPADGALLNGTWAALTWTAGDLATSHDVYLGTNFADVNEATPNSAGVYLGNQTEAALLIGTAGHPYPEGLAAKTTYYWRLDEVSPQGVLKGKVWSFTVPSAGAWRPVPADGARFVDAGSDLAWTRGLTAVMFAVYFGDNLDTVTGATVPLNMTIQTTFDPGPLQQGKTYYWRVDEFDGKVWTTGAVWRFTVAPAGGGIKGEYFNRMDPGGAPVLTRSEIEVAFSEVYTFYTRTDDGSRLWIDDRLIVDKWVWVNRVVDARGEPIPLVAGQRYSIQMEWYNEDGSAEAHLLWESARQPKGIVPAAALTPPFKAGAPAPGRDATDVAHTATLVWSAGDYAAEHDVYFGDNKEAVANATTASTGLYQGRQALERVTFNPGTLEWNKTYYWRIDEVNDAHPDSPWKGPVWSFTTANFLVVDDFESYTDEEGRRIFEMWLDGWESPTNGSQVGHTQAPFAETSIVHGGRQAMPLSYDNTAPPSYSSQAERTWAQPQDWTVNGINTLTLYYQGDAANTEGPLYVAVEDSASRSGMSIHPDAAAVLTTTWTQWDIPLSTFSTAGVDLRTVKKLSLGVGNPKTTVLNGRGQIYIDDIRVIKR